MNLYVVAVGNPFDGITLYGPYAEEKEEDLEWAADRFSGETWWVMKLEQLKS